MPYLINVVSTALLLFPKQFSIFFSFSVIQEGFVFVCVQLPGRF